MHFGYVSLVAVLAVDAGASPGPKAAPPAAANLQQPGAQEALRIAGKKAYAKYCELCHGADGVGYGADHANQLSNPLFLATASDEFLAVAIERGRPGTPMAAYHQDFGGPLKDEDTDALLAYIASLRQTDLEKVVVRGSSARGAPLYAKKCASCHGQKGEGHTALSLDNPIFLATASDGYLRYAIEYGRPGTPMVGFGAKLSSGQIADLTAFIRGWSRNVDSGPVGGEDLPTPDQLILNPAGAAPRFSPLREGRYLPAKELHEALKSGARIVVLDARPPSDWIKSHIPGAYPAPYYSDGPELTTLLPRDGTWIVAYCGCPHAASGKVIDKLRAAGFVNTAVMDEGIFEWSRMKLPVTFGKPKPDK